MTNATKASGWYGQALKGWRASVTGDKPTDTQLHAAHALGCRPGKQAFALAMTLRDAGATGSQIVVACGAPQNNKRRDLIAKGLLKRLPMATGDNGHSVYRVEVTAKGTARIAAYDKAAVDAAVQGSAKPVKAKAKRKAKAAPVVTVPTGDAPVDVMTTNPVEGDAVHLTA